LVGYVLVLWSGFGQHYGGLDATREMFYQQPNWQQYPPEYIKKIQSNRIFSTLVYPNALAAAILLLLPPLLLKVWSIGARWNPMVRAVLVGTLAYASLACLFWSGSKSGWLIALVLMLLMVLFQPFAKRLKMILVGAVLLMGLAGFFIQFASYFHRGAPS